MAEHTGESLSAVQLGTDFIHRLSNELIEIIATHLREKADIISFRKTSRTICLATDKLFGKRCLKSLEFPLARAESLETLVEISRSSHKSAIRSLIVFAGYTTVLKDDFRTNEVGSLATCKISDPDTLRQSGTDIVMLTNALRGFDRCESIVIDDIYNRKEIWNWNERLRAMFDDEIIKVYGGVPKLLTGSKLFPDHWPETEIVPEAMTYTISKTIAAIVRSGANIKQLTIEMESSGPETIQVPPFMMKSYSDALSKLRRLSIKTSPQHTSEIESHQWFISWSRFLILLTGVEEVHYDGYWFDGPSDNVTGHAYGSTWLNALQCTLLPNLQSIKIWTVHVNDFKDISKVVSRYGDQLRLLSILFVSLPDEPSTLPDTKDIVLLGLACRKASSLEIDGLDTATRRALFYIPHNYYLKSGLKGDKDDRLLFTDWKHSYRMNLESNDEIESLFSDAKFNVVWE